MSRELIKLRRADSRTGRALDENYILQCNIPDAIKPILDTYFDDLESAINYIDTNKSLHVNVEFHICIDDKHVYMDISEVDNITELFFTPNFQRGRK